jgi:hypothetical protein
VSGLRYNKGKPRMSLLPFDALYELASLFTESMKKYPARNWERGLSWSETQDSLLRHMTAWSNKEDKDAESGFYHDVHILWNAIVLVTMRLRGLGKDDRKSNPVSDDVPTHSIKRDISNSVVPVTAPDYPVTRAPTDDVAYVVRPDDHYTESWDGPITVVDPVTGKIIG